MKQILDWNYYKDLSRKAVSEGLVLLENKNKALPFTKGMNISIFGRIQTNYYKSGTGSGGLVNVSHVTGIPEGLRESGVVQINEELYKLYEDWEKENPFDSGLGWGMEPWSQPEMELSDDVAKKAANVSDAALVIIGRTAGEEKDFGKNPGSFFLTDIEKEMLRTVRKNFGRMVVLLNVGGLIDLSFFDEVKPDALVFGWQGGMVGGHGTADVLCGKVSPSGKLVDTIAYDLNDYPSSKNFGDEKSNEYKEGIFVGYRYFETSAKDKVRYTFGYGLSYTTFDITGSDLYASLNGGNSTCAGKVTTSITVENTGDVPGKCVVQIYASCPKGKLEKPEKVLVAVEKTRELKPGEKQEIEISFDVETFASYDDKGVTGHKSSWVLEAGEYSFFAGDSVRDVKLIGRVNIEDNLIEELEGIFENAEPDRKIELPEEIPYTGRKGISLSEVYNDLNSVSNVCDETPLKNFVAQLSDEELSQIVRGEGMGSSLVTPGTAAAFGGVSKSLRDLGIAACCCADGPSGMRLDCGTKAFSLPNGTLLACTFNKELNEELFSLLGLEMINNKVDCLLGPGINIHRHPLNGRNFEYFSEDPLVTGLIATAQLKGLKKF